MDWTEPLSAWNGLVSAFIFAFVALTRPSHHDEYFEVSEMAKYELTSEDILIV